MKQPLSRTTFGTYTLPLISGVALAALFFLGGDQGRAQQIDVKSDMSNAVQNIGEIRFAPGGIKAADPSIEVVLKSINGILTLSGNILIGTNDILKANPGDNVTLIGGNRNQLLGAKQSALIGGNNNRMYAGENNAIVGGEQARIFNNSDNAVIAGGTENKITGSGNTIIGGDQNAIIGSHSMIAGGQQVQLKGSHSFAAGKNITATTNESFIWSDSYDGRIAPYGTRAFSPRSGTFAVRALNGIGINTDDPQVLGMDVNGLIQLGYDGISSCNLDNQGALIYRSAEEINSRLGGCFCECSLSIGGEGEWKPLSRKNLCTDACNEGILYQCTGTPPANAQRASSDENSGLTANTPITLSPSNDPNTKCEYVCKFGYMLQNRSCVATTRVQPCEHLPATNASWNTASEITQMRNGSNWLPSSIGSYNKVPSTSECRFTCDYGYRWDSNSKRCVFGQQRVLCTGLALNAQWNTASEITQTRDGTQRLPSNIGTYRNTASSTECVFNCQNNYEWDHNARCIPQTRNQQSCIGLVSNASWNTVSEITQTRNGSDWAPSTIGNHNSQPSTSECRFKCNEHYSWNGRNTCVADTQTTACTGLPANATWNRIFPRRDPSITQTWNGATSQWYPSHTGYYHTTPSDTECRFKCDEGLLWDGTACCELNHSWNGTECVPDFGTIVIPYGTISITLMDKNIGASQAGTGPDSYGHYFQRGNNYGFPNSGALAKTSTIRKNTLSYNWNNPYSNDTFIIQSLVTDWSLQDNPSLRGGVTNLDDYELHTTTNTCLRDQRGVCFPGTNVSVQLLTAEAAVQRQGPCPEGYHIPSQREWQSLYRVWQKSHSSAPISGPFAYDITDYYLAAERIKDFKMPVGGLRQFNGSTIGATIPYHTANYWSSTPVSYNQAYIVHFQDFGNPLVPYGVYLKDDTSYRNHGNLVRCFKNP